MWRQRLIRLLLIMCLFLPVFTSTATAGEGNAAGSRSGPEAVERLRLDINTASASEIAATLPGIGPVKAAAIVEYRRANGLFRTPDQLLEVRGIGPRTLEKIEPFLRIGSVAADNRRRDLARQARERGQARVSAILSVVREDRRRALDSR
ncbi:MAG: hypothetical protein CSB44_00695 [Gammaproteobacteria bacterium]|nr:MAG: hypothetical protein CSB44_00695 [Gammaproteobacteria bacterium]